MKPKTWIVTGANRGLGCSIAKYLSALPDARVILAVRDCKAGRQTARRIGPNVAVRELDLKSKDSIERFIESDDAPVAGLVNNAGIQIGDRTRWTDDGLEETFAVSHLHALKLTLGLLPRLDGGRVMFIGSGTHNPKHPTARPFGFRGERFESIAQCANGIEDGRNHGRLGKDRYATSKFLNMVSTVELARRIPSDRTCFLCLDPGLMPGTALARSAPAPLRFGWHYVLPLITRLLPDASTPDRSGRAAARLLGADSSVVVSGAIYSYDLARSRRVIERVLDPEIGRQVIDDSLELLGLDRISQRV